MSILSALVCIIHLLLQVNGATDVTTGERGSDGAGVKQQTGCWRPPDSLRTSAFTRSKIVRRSNAFVKCFRRHEVYRPIDTCVWQEWRSNGSQDSYTGNYVTAS